VPECGHRRPDLGRRPQAELGDEPGGAQDPQRIVVERVLRQARRAQDLVTQVGQAAERVDQLDRRQPGRDRVDGEVTPGQVGDQRRPVRDIRLARGPLVLLAAVGGDLELRVPLAQADGAEPDPDRPGGVGPAGRDRQHALRRGVGRHVQVAVLSGQERVPDGSADQRELVTLPGEHAGKLLGAAQAGGQRRAQQGAGRALLLRRYGSGIVHGQRG